MKSADESPPRASWLCNWIRLNGNALSWIAMLTGLLLVGAVADFR